MPNSATITAFNVFTPGTKARATEVNTNFSIFRGHSIPVDPNTATSGDNTWDHGSSEYRWRNHYSYCLDLKSSTSTAGLQIKGDLTHTAGSLDFWVAGSKRAGVRTAGLYGIDPSQAVMTAHTFTAGNSSFTIPAGTVVVFAAIQPPGGGGGGGGGGQNTNVGGGGGGGEAIEEMLIAIPVTALEVFSITVGAFGVGGSGGAAANGVAGTNGGTTTVNCPSAGYTIKVDGGRGGGFGVFAVGASASGGAGYQTAYSPLGSKNGSGAGGTGAGSNNSSTAGGTGQSTARFAGGTGGASAISAVRGAGGGGGGGAASSNGPGGTGGAGKADVTDGDAGSTPTGYGGGGGGGGGGSATGGGVTKGGAGGNGAPGKIVIYVPHIP